MTNLAQAAPRIPLVCFWEITDACNLRCIHCEANAGERTKDELTTEEALSLVDELAESGCKNVMLTGGEPLVRRDWPLISERLSDNGIEVTIITNGLLVDEKIVERMCESRVVGVSVSLDGNKEVHDTIRRSPRRSDASRYEAAIRAIQLLAASPLKTAVITQVHRRNIDDLG
ncbi:MAG: radical SAM protein, partial [Deltaproteobacteria bacterium]|nr:radical SAM protein [Deltaproteobacteria bacterium]